MTTRLDTSLRRSLFEDARTIRAFSGEPVPREMLAEIWESARWAPTARNLQPLRTLFLTTDQSRARLIGHLNESNRARAASAGAIAVFAVEPEQANLDATHDQVMNAALQMGFFLIAARAHGLHVGPMTGLDSAGVDSEFFSERGWKTLMIVNLGYPAPDQGRPRPDRLPMDEVVHWA